tara:strand:- start:690 stop:911 length:222 start_codon:yes stop_codon:yes gene_type:complete
MTVQKILETNVGKIVPTYTGKVYFHRHDSNGKNGMTRYNKPIGSMSGRHNYLDRQRNEKGQFVKKNAAATAAA